MRDVHMSRGYYAIGIIGCKTELNLGGLWRSAHAFGAAYIFCIAPRFHPMHRRQASDTTHAKANVPYYVYPTFQQFMESRPHGACLVAAEQAHGARALDTFMHPRCCIYLLGAEDTGIPETILGLCNMIVSINTPVCLNVATAGSIVLYDRQAKQFTARSLGEKLCSPIKSNSRMCNASTA